MQGRRVHPKEDGFFPYEELKPGDFFKFDGKWYGVTPNGHHCGLGNHMVSEHDDGTISVSPSIRVSGSDGELWHGFLEKGVWRSC